MAGLISLVFHDIADNKLKVKIKDGCVKEVDMLSVSELVETVKFLHLEHVNLRKEYFNLSLKRTV